MVATTFITSLSQLMPNSPNTAPTTRAPIQISVRFIAANWLVDGAKVRSFAGSSKFFSGKRRKKNFIRMIMKKLLMKAGLGKKRQKPEKDPFGLPPFFSRKASHRVRFSCVSTTAERVFGLGWTFFYMFYLFFLQKVWMIKKITYICSKNPTSISSDH